MSGRRRGLWIWYLVSLIWLALVVLLGLLTVFRALKTSNTKHLMQFEDIPLLRMADLQYPTLLWVTAGMAVFFLGLLAAACLQQWWLRCVCEEQDEPEPWWSSGGPFWLPCCAGLALGLGLVGCRYTMGSDGPEILPAGFEGWSFVLLGTVAGWWLCRAIVQSGPASYEAPCEPAARAPWLVRLAVAFLLGFIAVCVEAVWFHWKFWDKSLNGGYNYLQFFGSAEVREAQIREAQWVLHSASGLFASVAALAGCAWYLLFHGLIVGRIFNPSNGGLVCSAPLIGRVENPSYLPRYGLIPVLMAGLWILALGVAWEIKLLPDIRTAKGWILPAFVLLLLPAGLSPLLAVNTMMLRADFRRRRASTRAGVPEPLRPSELALWVLLLFPVYPLLRAPLFLLCRWIRRERWRYALLMVLSGAMLAGLMRLVTKIDDWFTYEDWRGMLREAEFPFLRVWLCLLSAYYVYLCGRRIGWVLRPSPVAQNLARGATRAAQFGVLATAAACVVFASWPFWGWDHMPKNVLARCVEFNTRHSFELSFLSWMFDFDRDGYSAVLHGADPDDFNYNVQAGGLAAPDKHILVPDDRFELADARHAKALPNGKPWSVVLLYLEGVIPRSIGAYGQRSLPGGLQATPNIDSVAAEGTVFTNARTFYPSTWDAWFAGSSGRFLRIVEMKSTELTGDRYSPHNNLYKILDLAGIDRWCHPDTAPYCDLLVPRWLHGPGRKPTWQPETEFSSALTAQDEEEGVWRGDKRMDRMVQFLDSIKPGERFFLSEHMCDTHFEWKPTPKEMAKKLGFPSGLEPYHQDLPNDYHSTDFNHYLESITRMDAQIGRLLKKLRERNLYDQTIIMIISDHGCQWWEHERMYYVSHLYDPAIRVPLIVRVPGQPVGRCDEHVMHLDLVPTLAELAGVRHANADETGPLPGRSLVPAIYGEGKVSKEVHEGFQNRDIPLLTHYDMLGVVHHFHYKLIFHRHFGTYLLFDLEKDPREMTNLADDEPELLEKMMDLLRQQFAKHKVLTGRVRDPHEDE